MTNALASPLFSATQALMAIDSTTGREAEVSAWLVRWLETRGYAVQTQPVEGAAGRVNVFAARGTPRIVLSTHIDCVPPFIAPRETETHHLGRGACDAKGIAAAMLFAGEALRESDFNDYGFLFVVGEETDSLGAKTFARAPLSKDIQYIIDGEPTDGLLSRGHKGVLALSVAREGVPGHSAYPERFDSALHGLVRELGALIDAPLPSDANFGTTTVNIGRLAGGVAGNVMAPHAEAEIVVRLARPLAEVEPAVRAHFSPATQITVRTASDPAEIFVPPGHASEIVRFGSDVPHLRPVAKVLLVGPGSIHDAHTAGEKLAKADQLKAVDQYVALVRELKTLCNTTKLPKSPTRTGG